MTSCPSAHKFVNRYIFLLRTSNLCVSLHISGMKVDQFQGIPNVLEVTCSGNALPSNVELMSMAMFKVIYKENSGTFEYKVLASLNFGMVKCFTSDTFSSCEITDKNSRSTTLKTLILDLDEGNTRTYACNVTVFEPGGATRIVTWRKTAFARSKSDNN